MTKFADFSRYGYNIERELGANKIGGRVTYLATQTKTEYKVVIKQFQFAQCSSSWSEYESIEREIEVLKGLKHQGIPCYLDSFQMHSGFCIVQEYKAASPLSISRSFNPEELKIIAVKILKILVYLQNRIPPIIHRDLKPDNILVDEHLNAFLVDFGFARIGDGEVGVSSVVKGTLGFMPPEQLFNRQLTEASDLYGLGMTLICLLTQTKIDDIGALVDISYRIRFKHLVPKLNVHWVKWLEKMVEPRLKERFPNAQEALRALPNSPLHPPVIQITQSEVHLQATQVNQQLSHCLEITNLAPEVTLVGKWGVKHYPQDPIIANDEHPWISIEPIEFEANWIRCTLKVDTSLLMAGETYKRVLVLKTNAFPQNHLISLQIRTANLPVKTKRISLYPLLLLFLFLLLSTHSLLWLLLSSPFAAESLGAVTLGLLIGTVFGLQVAAWTLHNTGTLSGARLTSSSAACLGIFTLIGTWLSIDGLIGSWQPIFSGLAPGVFGGWLLGIGMGITIEKLLREQASRAVAILFVLLTSFLSIVVALGVISGFSRPEILIALTLSSVFLASLLINTPLNNARRLAEYRKSERGKIRP